MSEVNVKRRWTVELFGMNNPKKGAEDVTAIENLLPGVAGQKEDAARRAFKDKEQGCTVRLFGTNSLKKGAV
jgi:predicted molibdopterin-dependent oxidoreductase YjgC